MLARSSAVWANVNLRDVPRDRLIANLKSTMIQFEEQGKPVLAYRFGFLRVPFEEDRSRDGLALHIWTKSLPADDCPHTHIFDLQSRVLLGAVTNMIWTIDDSKDGQFIATKPGYSHPGVLEYESQKRLNLVRKSFDTYTAGTACDYYELPKGNIHSSSFESDTVTLIRRSNTIPDELPTNYIPEG